MSVTKYVLLGIVIGVLAGIAEAMVTAIGAKDYWRVVGLHFMQLGFAGWGFGALGGYLVAKRVQRRRDMRKVRGQCLNCGYDLTGNVSGRCPECGADVAKRTD